MKTRIQGATLLMVCAFAVHRLSHQVTMLPKHEPAMGELILALIVVITGAVGALMVCVGQALFEPYEWPPKN